MFCVHSPPLNGEKQTNEIRSLEPMRVDPVKREAEVLMVLHVLNTTSQPQAVHGKHKRPLQSPFDKQTTSLNKPVLVALANPPAGSPDVSAKGRTGVHWLATYIRLLDSAKSRTLSPVKLRAIKHVHAASVGACLPLCALALAPCTVDYVAGTETAPLCPTSPPHTRGFADAPARVDLLQG